MNSISNPANTQVSFDFQVNQPETVHIRLSDYLGHEVNHTAQYLSGQHTFSFADISALTPGVLVYTVQIGSVTYSGSLIKS